MIISLNKTSFITAIDKEGKINIICEGVDNYSQLQVEVFNTGVKNPSSVQSFGASINITNINTYEIGIDIESFKSGVYEVKIIIFHTKKGEEGGNQLIFFGGKDFERLFFEITETQESKTKEELEGIVLMQEEKNEDYFLSGIDSRTNMNEPEIDFAIFVFVKGLLTGIKSRLDKFEIFPFEGLDRNDHFVLVNEFLKNRTQLNLEFDYTKERRDDSRRENPVSVVHFPCIIAESEEQAYNYAFIKTLYVLQAFSLQRGTSGEIFHTLVLNLKTGKSTLLYPLSPYRWNLLTGNFAGEHPETLEKHIEVLENNSFKSFLISLHKEALAEDNMNFKYLRYWQILETLAESRNYNKNNDLLDFNGEIIYEEENGKIKIDPKTKQPVSRKIRGSFNIVYNLMKEIRNPDHSDRGKQNEYDLKLRDDINIWLAFRNSVAHFGSIAEYRQLDNKKDKEYAEKGIQIIQATGTDHILWNLKEDVKLVLMRELNGS